MDANVNGLARNGAAEPPKAAALPSGKTETELPHDYDAGLSKAMALVWEERGKYSVLSETFYALTRVWEQLCAERDRRNGKAH